MMQTVQAANVHVLSSWLVAVMLTLSCTTQQQSPCEKASTRISHAPRRSLTHARSMCKPCTGSEPDAITFSRVTHRHRAKRAKLTAKTVKSCSSCLHAGCGKAVPGLIQLVPRLKAQTDTQVQGAKLGADRIALLISSFQHGLQNSQPSPLAALL